MKNPALWIQAQPTRDGNVETRTCLFLCAGIENAIDGLRLDTSKMQASAFGNGNSHFGNLITNLGKHTKGWVERLSLKK